MVSSIKKMQYLSNRIANQLKKFSLVMGGFSANWLRDREHQGISSTNQESENHLPVMIQGHSDKVHFIACVIEATPSRRRPAVKPSAARSTANTRFAAEDCIQASRRRTQQSPRNRHVREKPTPQT